MFPLEVTFKHLNPSETLKQRVYKEAQKIDKLFNIILWAKVVISLPHRSHHQGKIFHVNISLKVPGKDLVVAHTPQDNHALENAQVAVRDAFKAMEHELNRFIEKKRINRKPLKNFNIQLNPE